MSTHTATIRSPPESAYLTSQYGLLPSPLPPYLAANPSSNHMHPAEMSINPRYLPEPSNWAPDHYAHEQTYYAPVQIMHYPQVNQSSHLQNQNYYNAQSQLELEIVHTDQVWSLHQAIPVPPPLSQRSASPPAIHRSPEDSEVSTYHILNFWAVSMNFIFGSFFTQESDALTIFLPSRFIALGPSR